jgi:hypothetical protein
MYVCIQKYTCHKKIRIQQTPRYAQTYTYIHIKTQGQNAVVMCMCVYVYVYIYIYIYIYIYNTAGQKAAKGMFMQDMGPGISRSYNERVWSAQAATREPSGRAYHVMAATGQVLYMYGGLLEGALRVYMYVCVYVDMHVTSVRFAGRCVACVHVCM